MKKILAIIVSLICILPMYAEGHMTFKGVEIDGDLTSFIAKLETQGFKRNGVSDDYAVMIGTFTAEDVQLFINTTPISKHVYCVTVVYKPAKTWTGQTEHYKELVESLKKKYGTPIEEVWSVSEYLPVIDIRNETGTIMTLFNCENGGVTIGIKNVHYNSISTCITYWDKANNAKYKEEVASDL